MSDRRPRRIAHVWTPADGVLNAPVDDFPESIVHGAFIYLPDLAASGELRILRGRRTGVETVEYRTRRAIHCEDVPDLIEAYGITDEEIHGKRPHARAAR